MLVVLALLAIWEAFLITHRPATHGCGGNFSQYYTAGAIVCRGDVRRLYDQTYFKQLQQPLRDDPLPSIYPPTVGLLVAPLARLSYGSALAVWWAIHAVSILATGLIFYGWLGQARGKAQMRNDECRISNLESPGFDIRHSKFVIPRVWRVNALMALAALLPLWIAVGIGQFAPVFLLLLAGGLELHKRSKPVLAGLVLSLLALKPQLAAGLVLWMLLRRDFRTLLGLASGFALQAAAVAAGLGPQAWLDYLHALTAISAITRAVRFSPMVEASFTGMASNLASAAGLSAWEAVAMKVAYASTVSFARLCSARSSGRDASGPAPCRSQPTTNTLAALSS